MTDRGIAIIGCGGIAAAHVAAARAASLPVVAVVDQDPERAAKLAADTGARPFAAVDDMVAEVAAASLLAAVVCTPPSARLGIVGTLLGEGIPTLVEKPLAHTYEDAADVARLADRHPGVPTAVGFCHRFAPAVAEMRRRVALGQLGDLVRFENVFACWHPRMRGSWMSDRAVSGGGALIDTACHSLDLYAHLVGPPRFAGAVMQQGWPGRGETNATLLVGTVADAGGAAGVIAAGWAEPARFEVKLVGTQGLFAYDYDHPTTLRFVGSDGRSDTIEVETHETRFTHQLAAFADWVRTGKTAAPFASFGEALGINRVIEGAYAHAAGSAVAPSSVGYSVAAS